MYKETMSGEGKIFKTMGAAKSYIKGLSGFYEGMVSEKLLETLYKKYIIQINL